MVDLLIPGPEGKIEAKYTHNNNDQSPIVARSEVKPKKSSHLSTMVKKFRMFQLPKHLSITSGRGEPLPSWTGRNKHNSMQKTVPFFSPTYGVKQK